jgi:hypothetical protein
LVHRNLLADIVCAGKRQILKRRHCLTNPSPGASELARQITSSYCSLSMSANSPTSNLGHQVTVSLSKKFSSRPRPVLPLP